MRYFEDLHFVSTGVQEDCLSVVDRCFADSWSVEFMRSGRLAMGMNGGPQEVVETPIVFWHSPENSYQYGAVDEQGWHHHWVLMQGRRAERLVESGFGPLSPRGYLPVRQLETIESLFHRLHDLVQSTDPRLQAERVILVEQLLAITMEEARSPAPSHHRQSEIDAIAQAVSREPLKNYDFRQAARELSLSYHRFRHVFRQQVGQAPQAFLLNCRLRKAAEMLCDKTVQIQTVAWECGYEDPALFTRIFKKKIGLTPRQYRESHILL